MARNRAIRDEVAAKRITRAPDAFGLDRHIPQGEPSESRA
jgi:hypothetical protein